LTLKNQDIKSKLFLAYKIFFSLLIIPVVGYIAYKAIDKTRENIEWKEEGYFKDESEFKDTVVKAYINKNLQSSQEIRYIDWSSKPFVIREHTTVRWVKYSILDLKENHEIFYDRVFFIKDNKVIKVVDFN
jgi:hypothetical protein